MSMHSINNKIYKQKEWDTEENDLYLEKLRSEFFSLTPTSSHCPKSWAKEVYFFLKELDKDYGLTYEYHWSSLGYRVSKSKSSNKYISFLIAVFDFLIKEPLLVKWNDEMLPAYIKIHLANEKKLKEEKFSENPNKEKIDKLEKGLIEGKNRIREYRRTSIRKAWKRFFSSNFLPNLKRFLRNLKVKGDKNISLGQFKEKFGSVTFYSNYYNKPFKEDIDNRIKELSYQLYKKGAYPTGECEEFNERINKEKFLNEIDKDNNE